MKTKTIKTPSVGLTLILSICDKCYDSVFKSTLLRQSHTTRHNHRSGSIPQKEKQRKPFFSALSRFNYVRSMFSWFFLDEKESLKGITLFVGKLAGCLHTSRITTNTVNTLTRVSFSERGFLGFRLNKKVFANFVIFGYFRNIKNFHITLRSIGVA